MDTSEKKAKKIRVRGTATIDPSDNSFGFVPFNEAPSTQTNVKTCVGGGKSWITTGSNPSRMICLKSKESSPDQYADFLEQFNELTSDMKPEQPPQQPETLRVVSEEGVQCWLDEEKGVVTYTGALNLSLHCRDWQTEVLRQVQTMVRRLPASDKFSKLINNLKKEINHV